MATTYGWVTLAEAEAFMLLRWGADQLWVTGIAKESALQTAYEDLIGCGLYSFPTTASAVMKKAQYEQALFIIGHREDADRRKGLQMQGVVAAGIVKETYKKDTADIPISVFAHGLLSAYQCKGVIFAGDVQRDEETDVD